MHRRSNPRARVPQLTQGWDPMTKNRERCPEPPGKARARIVTIPAAQQRQFWPDLRQMHPYPLLHRYRRIRAISERSDDEPQELSSEPSWRSARKPLARRQVVRRGPPRWFAPACSGRRRGTCRIPARLMRARRGKRPQDERVPDSLGSAPVIGGCAGTSRDRARLALLG